MSLRMSKLGWLDLALTELSASGPDGLRLDAICASAGLTKGSFYHHFKNHGDFLIAVAERWASVQTDALIDKLDMDETITDEVFRQIDHLAAAIDMQLEINIRELARRVPDVARIVATTDEKRLAIGTQMYAQRFKAPEPLARQIAELDYAALSGAILINPNMSHADHIRLAELFRAMAEDFLSDGGP
ncbi:MAG: TetR/AcrR family transcriptional regulator [Pseudomonadota bacterium]